jgi:ABC-type multidrug transport system fused ATPase/permease subunit
MNTAVVLPAILLGKTIDEALALERGEASSSDVTRAALLLIAGTLLTECPRVLKRWWLMTANGRIRANVRADGLRGTLSRPLADLHRTSIGDLMARLVGDVEVLGVGVREFTIEIWDTVLFSISFVVAMAIIDAELTLMALAPVPIAMVIAHASGRWVGERTTRAREANGDLTSRIQELLTGQRVVRFFGRGEAATEDIARLSQAFARENLGATRVRLGLRPVYSMIMTAGVLFVVWRGGESVTSGEMTLGEFVAFLALFIRFVERGFRVPQLVNSIQSGGAAYARIEPLLAPALPVTGEPALASFDSGHVAGINAVPVIRVRSGSGPIGVSIRAVTFRYPGSTTPALRDLSLDIPAGSLVAVTGPIGSGKSALARCLLGVYPLQDGEIEMECEGSLLTPEQRQAAVGYLPQDARLFSGSIRENVLPSGAGQDAADSTGRAVALAALQDDLGAMPEGLDSQIGEAGVRVSGGQRQRIGLARAIAVSAPANPGLLVLDDPFAAVDVETEAKIIAGLRDAFGPNRPEASRVTILLCSQRLAVFPNADKVVVLQDGRIEEEGTHAELVLRGGLYARIFRAQARSDLAVTGGDE